ncbi:MinD/ParA family ATP-binding protein, partial [Mycobacterium avium]
GWPARDAGSPPATDPRPAPAHYPPNEANQRVNEQYYPPHEQRHQTEDSRPAADNFQRQAPSQPWPAQPDRRPVPAVRQPRQPAGTVALDHLDIKRKKVPAKHGWRAALFALTKINLGPGKDETYELSLQERVRRIVRVTFPIAVLNLKGGVGKTVVAEALGSTFAHVRGDRVLAVDLDTDYGNLVDRHGRQSSLGIIDLVSDPSVTRYLDVRAHTSMNDCDLEVLDGPDYARTDRPVDRDDFERAMSIFKEHYSLVVMDCGTGLKNTMMDAVLRESRALVVVTSASIDAMKETDMTLEWLRQSGYQQLLDSTVLVINHTERGKPNVEVPKAVEQWSRQIRSERIVVLPFDPHIHEGKEIILELLSKKSQRRYLEIAAMLADMFPKTVGE